MDKKWITGEEILRAHEEYMALVGDSAREYADSIPGLSEDERQAVEAAYYKGRIDEMAHYDQIMMDYLKRKGRL